MPPIAPSTAAGIFITIGLVLLVSSWARFKVNSRRFRRRTIGGGQRFSSYGWAVITQLWEGLVMGLATLSMSIALLSGIGLAVWLWQFG